jgi:hypothetical protein
MSEVNTDIFLNLVINGTPPLYTYIPLDKTIGDARS